MRLVSLLSGVLLFRLLVPEQYGTFALALGLANIAMSVNDLGLVVAMLRWPAQRGDPAQAGDRAPARDAAPTATTMVWGCSALLFGACAALAPLVAGAADRAEATAIVRVLCTLVLIDAACAIPRSLLIGQLQQARLAGAELAGVPLNVGLSVGLAAAGWGAWAPTTGTIAAAVLTAMVTLWAAPRRPRPGFDLAVARRLLAMGVPVAATSLVGLSLLNIDYLLVGTALGTSTLGFYALAFNVSSWPSTVLTQAVRRVAITGFARLASPGERTAQDAFVHNTARLLTLLFPLCGALIALAHPLVRTLYGWRAAPAAPMLAWLAVLGACRVLLGFLFDLLTGLGRSALMFAVHALWLAAAAPALLLGARLDAGRGAAAAHALVAVGVAIPAFALASRRVEVPIGMVARRATRPFAAAVLASTVGWAVQRSIAAPAPALLSGAVAMALSYGLVWAMVPPRRSLSWHRALQSAPSLRRWRR